MEKIDKLIQNIPPESTMLGQVKITANLCSFENMKELFVKIGEKILTDGSGEKFKVDENNQEVVNELLLYFSGNTETKLDLKKGIMLMGSVGAGKTMTMKIIQLMNANIFRINGFKLISARDIVKTYLKDGHEGISYLTERKKGIPAGTYSTICIDDIGATDELVNYFGTKSNIIAEIIQDRYEIFVNAGKLTHITTNLAPAEIDLRYGDRVRSRMREMFNQIELKGNDRRK